MATSKQATEQGFKELIEEQAKQPGRCLVTLAQFDTQYETLYTNLPIDQLPKFDLQPRWGTALLDAMGKFITAVGASLALTAEDDRPGTVICLIMTDGEENSSVEWTLDGVKALVTQQREDYQWQFIFMGANIDAVSVGASMGIPQGSSISYDAANASANMGTYGAASGLIANARSGMAPDQNVFSKKDREDAMGKAAVGKKSKATSGGKKR